MNLAFILMVKNIVFYLVSKKMSGVTYLELMQIHLN